MTSASLKSPIQLQSLIFAQPFARRFSDRLLADAVRLSEIIPAGRAPEPLELLPNFFSPHLRPADVPLAFQKSHALVYQPTRAPAPTLGGENQNLSQQLNVQAETYCRMIQYRFSDGLVLNLDEILHHPYSRDLSRHILPLSVNIRSEFLGNTAFHLELPRLSKTVRATWQLQAEQMIFSILATAQRSLRLAAAAPEDHRGPQNILFTFEENPLLDRQGLRIDDIQFFSQNWSAWRLNTNDDITDLSDEVRRNERTAEAAPQTYRGRARLELDPDVMGDLSSLSQSFLLDRTQRFIRFHNIDEQVHRLNLHTTDAKALTNQSAEERALHRDIEGLALHLKGHTNIQNAIEDVEEMLEKTGHHLPIYPQTIAIAPETVRPCLHLTGDGSVKFVAEFSVANQRWEAHGISQASSYLLTTLQLGIGSASGYEIAEIAHTRRGLKRERDLKVLRHLGFASFIFFEAAQFALGEQDQSLSGENSIQFASQADLCSHLFTVLGAALLKSEGWPTQSGTLSDLCSKSVTTAIESFVAQICADCTPAQAEAVRLYVPEGQLLLPDVKRHTVRFFYALVSDLAKATQGECFGKARTKYFEDFNNGRLSNETDDLVLRHAVDPELASKLIYQAGIDERYVLPESSRPPKGLNIFNLISYGFHLTLDGKPVEEFSSTDFRPEFNLRESPLDAATVAIGRPSIDWFELSPKFFFKGVEISSSQAQRLSREGMLEFQGKLFLVKSDEWPSLQRLNRFWSSIQSGQPNLVKGPRRKTEDTYYPLPRNQTLELLALRASGVKVRGGPRWDEITGFYDKLHLERDPLAMPDSFKATLQPYQLTGVQWLLDLYQLRLGGILADDMGLGKTVTSLAFLEKLRSQDKMGKCLVVVPTSLTYNWLSEAQRFAPEMPVLIFQGRNPELILDFIQRERQALIICTYGLLQEHAQLLSQVEWTSIVFDEAQNLKNMTTKRTTAARQLRSGFKVCLTGTPLENHYGEFYSLFDLIVPGSLGELRDFRETFVNPVRVLREDIQFLKLKAKPLLLRRTKAQVMSELPPKIESTIKLPFEDEQKKIYRDIATSYNEQIRKQIVNQGESKVQLQMLTALLRLRQACSDPASIPGVNYQGEPPKAARLVEALEELTETGASALVFTQFLTTFERIRKKLTEKNIRHFDISGADSRLAREKKLRAFQDESGGSVMLMTLKTGGVGLNLTKASYVFHIEPWWNPAVENQATDRAHRIGQNLTVQVYRYIIKESVEEKIELLKDIKSQRFSALFSNDESPTELGPAGTRLTQEDFDFLLS